MDFADRLKQLRKERGLTQEALAEKLGIVHRMISFYESGERIPTPKNLKELADFFNVSIDYLYGRSDTPEKKPERSLPSSDNSGEKFPLQISDPVPEDFPESKQNNIVFAGFILSEQQRNLLNQSLKDLLEHGVKMSAEEFFQSAMQRIPSVEITRLLRIQALKIAAAKTNHLKANGILLDRKGNIIPSIFPEDALDRDDED